MIFFSKTCDPCHVALCVQNPPTLLLNLTEFTRLHFYVFFVCGWATSKWSDVLFWEMIRLKSHKIIPKSIWCKEYIDLSNCTTWILLRIHAKLKHRLDRFVRNYPHVRNSPPLPYNNNNSSTGECVWINGEQNLQRQERVQQHWPPTPLAESRQLAVNTWVLGSILRACLFMIRLFGKIDGQNSNRI